MGGPQQLSEVGLGGGADAPGLGSFDAVLDELEYHRSIEVGRRLAAARDIEHDAAEAGDDVARMRARLIVADMLHRSGEPADAARLAVQVNAWAEARGRFALLSRSHLVLSAILEAMGDQSSALDHAVRALDVLDDASPRRRGDCLLRLADTLAVLGSEAEARRHYGEAAAAYKQCGDRERELNVINNLIVTEYEFGNIAAAVEAAERVAADTGMEELNPAMAETIARARLLAGDPHGAERAVLDGFRLLDEQGDVRAVTPAELHLSHAEVLLAQGRLDDADVALRRCMIVCDERKLASMHVEALRVGAELAAARGDYRTAYETHRKFHAEGAAVRSRQLEAAALTRQALFETAEARREAQRFWRQARTDPLTELHNRRFVDESLPRFLDDAARVGGTVVVGIVDVDRFKMVNDRWSHAVGDMVLRDLAGMLIATARGAQQCEDDEPGFAARLGGEEFLIVRRCAAADVAVAELELLRELVWAHDWSAIAGGLRVTVSVGVAIAQPGDDQTTLLGRADVHLHEAKASGRNRLIADPFVEHD